MKRFTEYLSEDVLPTANVQDGNFDIENDAVRSQVNGTLAAVVAQPAVTPYVLLHRISKALSYFSIILPKRTFLEGNKGVEVYEIMQFGDRMGMTDQGEFVTKVPTKFYLFFQYGVAHPFNVTYTKPNIDGMYRAMAKIVDQAELDKLLNAAEAMMAESCDDKATMSQRKGGREEIQTNGNHGTPSTDKAMDTSGEKSADVDKKWPAVVKEASTKSQRDAMKRVLSQHPDRDLHSRITKQGADERREKKSFASAKKEIKRLKEDEQIDEGGMPPSVIKHKQKLASMSPEELKKKFAGKSEEHLKSMARRHGYGKDSDVYSKHIKEEKKPKPVNLTPRQQQDKTIPSSVASYAEKIYQARTKQLRAPRTDYSKNVSENVLDEVMGSIKKAFAMKKMKKKVNTQVKQGLGVGKEKTSTVLVTNKGDPKAAGGGGVHRISKDKYDPKKHNLASE